MSKKLTEKQKRLKRDLAERRQKNKLEKTVVIKENKQQKDDETFKEMNIEPNKEWLNVNYPTRKRFELYNDYVKNYNVKNLFRRDVDWENYNFVMGANLANEIRNFVVEYEGDNAFLTEMASCVEYYRCRKYREASMSLLKVIEKYPDEGWGYYYFGRAFSYGYVLGNGELYSLRFLKRAVELNGYLEMYLEYANMLMVCGNILARSDMPTDAEFLYKCSIEVYNEAESKYPECGDISRMRDSVPTSKKAGRSVSNLSKKYYTFDNEAREWITDALLFPVEQDLLL